MSFPIRTRKTGRVSRPFGTWLDYTMILLAIVLFLVAMVHVARV